MQIQYINHACLKITVNKTTLLTDPWILNHPVKATSVWKFPPVTMTTDEILDNVDYVYISHSHEDHFHVPSLDLIPRNTKFIIPVYPEHDFDRDKLIFNVLNHMGFNDICLLNPWQGKKINDDLKVTIIPAANSRYYDWENSGLLISSNSTTLLNMNDNVPDKELCKNIINRFNRVDIAFVQTAGISAYPSCFEMSKFEKEKNIIKKTNDFLFQDLIMDVIKPSYVIPFAGDFGWFHEFQYDHNYFARSSPIPLYEHIQEKGFQVVRMEPSDYFSISEGLTSNKQRINWGSYKIFLDHQIDVNKSKISSYYSWLKTSKRDDLYKTSEIRINKILEFYFDYKMEMTASIAYFIDGQNSNFSIIIESVLGKNIKLYIKIGKNEDTDQTHTIPEFIWASIIDGKILWNNVQWLTTIKENKLFNNEMRDLIFWLGYYIDLGSRNPEVIINGSIIGKPSPYIRLGLKPDQ